MNNDKELGNRLKWLRAINGIKTRDIAAEKLGIPFGTYQRWEHGGTPNRNNFKIIAEYYNCSLSWLMTGDGEPFPGARAKYPEICGPEYVALAPGQQPGISEPAAAWIPTGPSAQTDLETQRTAPRDSTQPPAPKVSEDLTMAAQVLESGTHYAVALHMNIHSFHRAVCSDAYQTELQQQMQSMQNIMSELQKNNEDLKKDILLLKKLLSNGDGHEGSNSSTG